MAGPRFWGPKSVAIALLVGMGLIAALILLVRRDHDAPAVARLSASERSEPPDVDELEGGGQESPEESLSEPVRPETAPPKPSADVPMSAEAGLVRGRLPTPDGMRSGPQHVASPAVQRGMEERASRAAILDRRLESQIGALKQSAQAADPESRQAIEHDIRILESQLKARRAWETPSKVPRR